MTKQNLDHLIAKLTGMGQDMLDAAHNGAPIEMRIRQLEIAICVILDDRITELKAERDKRSVPVEAL